MGLLHQSALAPLAPLAHASAAGWTLLVKQSYGAGFFTYSDWYRNAHNPQAELFSRLGDLESFRGRDGRFHLLLWWPEVGRGNEWRQASNPVTRAGPGVAGYSPANISYSGEDWGGLERNNQQALLDGSLDQEGKKWWFAVGSFGAFGSGEESGIPGPDGLVVHQVELYVWEEQRFQLGPVFQSGMVLQAGQGHLVWGYHASSTSTILSLQRDGEEVVEVEVQVEADGSWRAEVPGQAPGTGYSLRVTSGQQELHLEELSFGEVWVCSGQSNMEFAMSGVLEAEQEIAASARYTQVRFAKVALVTAGEEMGDLWGGLAIPWSSPGDQEALAQFSAVCFLYGRMLYDQLEVPIGLVEAAWGGTSIETWMSEQARAACGLNKLPDYGAGIQNEESQCWHAMLAPLTRITIRGALWYQGETNVYNENRDLYACAISSMLEDWRAVWSSRSTTNATFPFGFVQLGSFNEQVSDNNPNSDWSLVRWHQTGDHGSVPNTLLPNTFMAAAMDTHDPSSPWGVIHPRDKLTVAQRLAWAGLATAYGYTELPTRGPQPKLSQEGTWVYRVVYDQEIQVNSFAGWQVCLAPTVELCDHLVGWKEVVATSSTSQSILLDLSSTCSSSPCSALAYLWRETPCLTPLSCPVYATAPGALPATPWIFHL